MDRLEPVFKSDIRDSVRHHTVSGRLMDPEDLFSDLFHCRHIGETELEELALDQVVLARQLKASEWLKRAARAASSRLSDSWISMNISPPLKQQRTSSTFTSGSIRDYQSTVNPNLEHLMETVFSQTTPTPSEGASVALQFYPSLTKERNYSNVVAGIKRVEPVWRVMDDAPAGHGCGIPGDSGFEAPALVSIDVPITEMSEHRDVNYEAPLPPESLQGAMGAPFVSAIYDNLKMHIQSGHEERQWDSLQTQNSSSDKHWSPNTRSNPMLGSAHPVSRSRTERLSSPDETLKDRRGKSEDRDILHGNLRERDIVKPKKRRFRLRVKRCSIAGCGMEINFVKQHLIECHIPAIFDERLEPTIALCQQRFTALTIMAKGMFGHTAKLDNLVKYLNTLHLIAPGWEINKVQKEAMEQLCLLQKWEIPKNFILDPVNSPAALIHWRSLLAINSCMSEDLTNSLRTSFEPIKLSPVERLHEETKEVCSKVSLPVVFGYDSHFHLDLLQETLGLPRDSTVLDVTRAMQHDDAKYGYHLEVSGCTAVFFDPKSYPSRMEAKSLTTEGTKVVIGAHPKNILSPDQLEVLQDSLQMPEVVGLEVGLDHSVHPDQWFYQEEQLKTVLGYLRPEHVLVVHCRGMTSDSTGFEAYMRCLGILSSCVPSSQPIHLHCFAGTKEVVNRWLDVFPNTRFGLTGLARSFVDRQLEAVMSIPLPMLILETDGPYFPICEEFPVSAPHLLGFVAEAVASILRLPMEEVLKLTEFNAMQLYCNRNQ